MSMSNFNITENNAAQINPDDVRDVFEEYRDSVSSNKKSYIERCSMKDLDPSRAERRAGAICSTWPELCCRFRLLLNAFPDSDSAKEHWIRLNAASSFSLDILDSESESNLGAARWIYSVLDKNVLHEFLSNMGSESVDRLSADDQIQVIHSILDHRNDDCAGQVRMELFADLDRPLMDVYTYKGEQHQNVPSRRHFESLMSLIPQNLMGEAVSAYTETFWDWAERLFQSLLFLDYSRMVGLGTLELCADQLREEREYSDGTGPEEEGAEMVEWLDAYIKRQESDASDGLVELVHDITSQEFYDVQSSGEDWYSGQLGDIWRGFRVEDPDQLSVGLLALLDFGSDLPWLGLPCTGLYCAAAAER